MSTPSSAETPAFGKGLDQLKNRRDRRKPPSKHPRPETPASPPPDQEKDQGEQVESPASPPVPPVQPVAKETESKPPVPEAPIAPPPPRVEQVRPPEPKKPAENAADGRKEGRRAADTGNGKSVSPARADAALKTATNLASAWAANEQRQRKRLVELVDALTKSSGLGVSREELVAALLSTQRRVGVDFPESLWQALDSPQE